MARVGDGEAAVAVAGNLAGVGEETVVDHRRRLEGGLVADHRGVYIEQLVDQRTDLGGVALARHRPR